MDKQLFIKQKNSISDSQKDRQPDAAAGGLAVPVGAYNPELSMSNWNRKQGWNSGPGGRALIRVFSRGALGAAFFAAGGWYVSKQGGGMEGYRAIANNAVDFKSGMKGFATIYEQHGFTKPLQYVAKVIDEFAGRPIKAMAGFFGADSPEYWVRFRPTMSPSVKGMPGRSLGEETVGITFDFFSASVGDALGRDIADNIDPNNKKKIWKDEKGRNSLRAAIENAEKALWRYVSYNGGEDWAVAIPYAYYLRAQRNLINHFSPGFMYDSDRSLNGASFRLSDNRVVGNYNLEGILDLQGRFTAYNIGTLMYREAYNHIENTLRGHPSALYGAPHNGKVKKQGVFEQADELLKWTARSMVKGVIYMTPAVPFFSVFRTSQSKYKGLFIQPHEDGVNASLLSYKSDLKTYEDAIHANELRRTGVDSDFSISKNVFSDQYSNTLNGWSSYELADNPLSRPLDPFAQSHTGLGQAYEKLGRAQNRLRSWANDLPRFIKNKEGFWGKLVTKNMVDRYVNAMWSYTPYMYAKGEAAIWFDNGKTDTAIERMVDGLDKMDVKEFKAGANEVWRAMWHTPFKDPARDAEGERRREIDTSAADDATKEQINKIRARQQSGYNLQPWQQRLVKRPAAGQASAMNGHADRAQPWQERVVAARPAAKEKEEKMSHAEQEAMRKALEELQPPTNSIH